MENGWKDCGTNSCTNILISDSESQKLKASSLSRLFKTLSNFDEMTNIGKPSSSCCSNFSQSDSFVISTLVWPGMEIMDQILYWIDAGPSGFRPSCTREGSRAKQPWRKFQSLASPYLVFLTWTTWSMQIRVMATMVQRLNNPFPCLINLSLPFALAYLLTSFFYCCFLPYAPVSIFKLRLLHSLPSFSLSQISSFHFWPPLLSFWGRNVIKSFAAALLEDSWSRVSSSGAWCPCWTWLRPIPASQCHFVRTGYCYISISMVAIHKSKHFHSSNMNQCSCETLQQTGLAIREFTTLDLLHFCKALYIDLLQKADSLLLRLLGWPSISQHVWPILVHNQVFLEDCGPPRNTPITPKKL